MERKEGKSKGGHLQGGEEAGLCGEQSYNSCLVNGYTVNDRLKGLWSSHKGAAKVQQHESMWTHNKLVPGNFQPSRSSPTNLSSHLCRRHTIFQDDN